MGGFPLDRETGAGDPADHPAAWIALALFVPLAIFPPEARGESMAGCALLACLLALLVRKLPAPPRLELVLPALAVLAVPVALAAGSPGEAVEPLATALVAVALGIAAARLPPASRDPGRLCLVLAVVGGLVSLHAIYQKLWGLDALIRHVESGGAVVEGTAVAIRARQGRAFAGFPTPAALGGFLALTLPLTAAAIQRRRGRARAWPAALGALQVGGFLAAASATAAAALAGATLLALVVAGRLRGRALVALAVGAAILGGVVVLRRDQVLGWSEPDSPWRLRAGNFRIAVAAIADRPWLGAGPGGFAEVYPQYRRGEDNESRHVHDLPLELGAELGVPAGAVVTGLFLWLFAGPLLRSRRERAPPPGELAVAVGLGAFALHNLADFTAFLPSVLWTAALLRGWIARAPRGSGLPPSTVPATAGLAVAVTAAALVALAGLAWNARTAGAQAAAAGDHETAVRQGSRSVRLAPWSADGWLFLAEADLRVGPAAGRSAREHLEANLARAARAVAASPQRPAARRLRSRIRLALGDAPGAFADAREAARLYPVHAGYARELEAMRSRLPSPPRGQRP